MYKYYSRSMKLHKTYEMTERNQSLSWKDIFLCYPIFDNICSHLDPVDILCFRLTTKKLSPFFESLFKTQWNINRQLTRYVKDPVSFRSLLAKHDALISGAFAREIWHDSELSLDIFVDSLSPFRTCDPLDKYLMGCEGYELQSVQPWSSNTLHLYAGPVAPISELKSFAYQVQIKTYHRRSSTKAKAIQVRIIYTIGIPLMAIFHVFRRSFVVNIISWNFGYSLFPDVSYIKRTAHCSNGGRNPNSEVNGKTEHLKRRYRSRTWTWKEAVARGGIKKLHSLQLNSRRRIGDSYTWSIALDTNGVKAGQPTSILQHSFFKVEKYIDSRDYLVRVEIFRSPVLRYEYTTSHKVYHDPRAFWVLVEQKLAELTNAELSKIPEDERPAFLGTNRPTFERASQLNWTFYDDQVPIWYEQYLKDEAERVRIIKKKAREGWGDI
ncbi:hypothetical protein CJF31_00005151 [Rutstroemia sp. NJR-2017a BVV2]|nr:hypothetical protein CJF31_00005151 [Rutstroemia sp. NJR-2017a BVV2]